MHKNMFDNIINNRKEENMDNHTEDLENLWEKSETEVIRRLNAGEKMEEIVAFMGEEIKTAFVEEPVKLGCSDGRIKEHRLGGAGDFILASWEEREKFISENKGKIKEVTSHDGCGAAGLKFKAMQEEGEATLPDGVTTADELGVYYAKKLAEELGAEYRHISAEEMTGDIHNERVIYFDGTGKFNPRALKEMPAGFISTGSKFGFSDEYCREELSALSNIAFGHHGFGDKFTKENPLYIIISASDEEELVKLKQVAESAAKQFDGRVVVDGFVVEKK
jgi:hypothetical protein